jgi:hypothetical protein
MISIPIIALLLGFVGLFVHYRLQKNWVLSEAAIWEHIKRHHHIRGMDARWSNIRTLQPFVYNEIVGAGVASPEDPRNTVLIQGDSWIEQMEIIGAARDVWKRYADEQKVRVVNAGTASYSPSPMTVQLRTLASQFRVRPRAIVALFDQTDVGDEACRYGNRLSADPATGEMIVLAEGAESYDDPQYWQVMVYDTFRRDSIGDFRKFFEYYKVRLGQEVKRLTNPPGNCRWADITRWLRDGNREDREAFASAFKRYLAQALSMPSLECLLVVTHPHRGHLAPLNDEEAYVADAGEIVRGVVNATGDRRMVHLNYTDRFAELYDQWTIPNIFHPSDPSSHLTEPAQTRLAESLTQELVARCR